MPDNKLLQTILDKVSTVDQNVIKLSRKVDSGFESVNNRLDKLGLQLARLEDDTPTLEEFGDLRQKVENLDKRTSVQ